MTYKIASDLSQRRARQLWLADLQGTAWEALPLEEQRANLVRAKNAITEQLLTLPKNSEERRSLGLVAHELDGRIAEIRPKLRRPRSTPDYFVEVARERLSPFMFKTFLSEASKRAEEEAA